MYTDVHWVPRNILQWHFFHLDMKYTKVKSSENINYLLKRVYFKRLTPNQIFKETGIINIMKLQNVFR